MELRLFGNTVNPCIGLKNRDEVPKNVCILLILDRKRYWQMVIQYPFRK